MVGGGGGGEGGGGFQVYPYPPPVPAAPPTPLPTTARPLTRSLNALIVTNNQITSLQAVAGLPALNTLVVSHNPLKDCSGLAGCAQGGAWGSESGRCGA